MAKTMRPELWKPVTGYRGLYEVSNRGGVRSLDRVVSFVQAGVSKKTLRKGRVLVPRCISSGYYQVVLSKTGVNHAYLVHRLVAAAFISNPENLPVVMHLDDDRKNNVVQNLKWSTQKDNLTDMVNKGRGDQMKAKLTEEQLGEIHRLLRLGESQVRIAAKFSISQALVSSVNTGKYRL